VQLSFAAAYERKLRQALKEKQVEREEALATIKKAEKRLKVAEEELQKLGAIIDG